MTHARAERAALSDLLDSLGPDAPTLCEGWTTADLAAHIVIRERRPDAAAGVALKPLAGYTASVQNKVKTGKSYPELVDDVRNGPPRWSPYGLVPGLDAIVNTLELFVHHEDVRRAQPGWAPRDLPRSVQDQLWRSVPLMARGPAATSTAGGLFVRRSDVPDGAPGSERRLRDGQPTTTVIGAPLEVLLWVSGRATVACVDLTVE